MRDMTKNITYWGKNHARLVEAFDKSSPIIPATACRATSPAKDRSWSADIVMIIPWSMQSQSTGAPMPNNIAKANHGEPQNPRNMLVIKFTRSAKSYCIVVASLHTL